MKELGKKIEWKEEESLNITMVSLSKVRLKPTILSIKIFLGILKGVKKNTLFSKSRANKLLSKKKGMKRSRMVLW